MLVSKTIRAELYGLTRFKRKLLEDLQAEWDRAQALERPDSERANEAALLLLPCFSLEGRGQAEGSHPHR